MGLGSNIAAFFGWTIPANRPARPSDAVPQQQSEQLRELIAATYSVVYHSSLDPLTGETPEIREEYLKSLKEPMVKAAILSKVYAVCSLDLNVLPEDDKNPLDLEIAKFCQAAVQKIKGGTAQLLWDILAPACLLGWSVTEPVWGVGRQGVLKGKRTIYDTKQKDTRLILPLLDRYRNVIGLRSSSGGMQIDFDPADFVIYSHMKIFENPTGMSDIRAAYRGIVLKEAAVKLRMLLLDKYSGPYFVGKSADRAVRRDVAKLLQQARGNGYIVVPENAEIEVMNLATSGTSEFDAAIDALDKEIVTSITGATLQMMEGDGGGARGNSLVQRDTADLFVWFLSNQAAAVIQDQLLPPLVCANFGPDAPLPMVQLSAVNPQQVLLELQVDQALNALGLPLSKADIYKRANRKPPSDLEDTLAGASPAAPVNPLAGMFGLPQLKPDAAPITPQPSNPPKLAPDTPGTGPVKFGEEIVPDAAPSALEDLIRFFQSRATELLGEIYRSMIARKLDDQHNPGFTTEETLRLADLLSGLLANSELLARSSIAQTLGRKENFAETIGEFPIDPKAAYDYFSTLVPIPGISTPGLWAEDQHRAAFTMAVNIEQTAISRVQSIIEDTIATGQSLTGSAADVQRVLDRSGITPENSGYADMVVRTNVMDSYHQALKETLALPEIADEFPVWRYDGILDGREGDDHRPHFGKYFSSVSSFEAIRGPRVFNCRCCQTPIYKDDWTELQAKGAKIG